MPNHFHLLVRIKEEKEIDFSSFSDYFVYRFIPSPKTIWKNIQKIPPAHFLKVDLKSLKFEIVEYWKLKSVNNSESQKNINRKVQNLLLNSVRQHSRADVEIGSFLSGGYDSSALVLFMKKLKLNPQTFSIGFSNWDKSEDQFAIIVAKHLNVANKSIITDDKSLELINIMPTVYDEPIADISIIPTYLVSNLAKSKVKAVMSGEGADEIFGGYTWHLDYWKKSYPKNIFKKLMKILNPIDTVAFYANAMSMGLFDKKELVKMLHPRLHKYISKDVNWFYSLHLKKEFSPLKRIQYLDIKSFMGELVLTKVDRASMSNSLEVRVPFLDHELVEYIFSLEEKVYFNPNQTKKLLFEQIKNDLPQQILSRKKQGFVGPDIYYMDIEWYKTELKNSNLVKYEIIQQDYLDSLLKESYNWKLWKILVMEKWYSRWIIE
jgi:asparagine synthase (glutamine-hydrolysing)